MLLSSNIPLQQLVAEFVSQSVVQASEVICIAILPDVTTHIQTQNGIYEEAVPHSLHTFLQNNTTGWYALNETPFNETPKLGQSKLEAELDRDILFIKNLKASSGQLYLFVKVKPFGLHKEKYLLANEKILFERTIRGFVESLTQIQTTDKEIMERLAKGNNLANDEIIKTKKQLAEQTENFQLAISQFTELVLNELQTKYKIEIRMSRAFSDELKDYSNSFYHLKANLEQHIEIAVNMALLSGDTEIVLTSNHLTDLKASKAKTYSTETEGLNLGRYTKTYVLLDRYEEAANITKEKSLNVIGKNIGANCTPPVSNASITDALNKHARKIVELFDRYPKRWPIIRREFRSVANIIEKESKRQQRSA